MSWWSNPKAEQRCQRRFADDPANALPGYQTPCPEGTSDNSPAIYRWVDAKKKLHQSRRDG
jgi:hypothetical protein